MAFSRPSPVYRIDGKYSVRAHISLNTLRASLPIPRKISRQRLPRIRLLHPRHLLRRALSYDPPAFFAAFRAEINNPIGIPDHIQIMFDDDDRIAQVGQPVQDVE